jgi:LAO/AO transport system kinase
MLMMSPQRNQWQPPVLATQAINDVGIAELYREVEKHRQSLGSSGELSRKRRQQRKEEFLQTIEQRLRGRLWKLMKGNDKLLSLLGRVENGELDPYSAVEIMESEALSRGWFPR